MSLFVGLLQFLETGLTNDTALWQGPTRLAKTSGPVRQKQRVGKALKAGAMCAILAEIDASNRQLATAAAVAGNGLRATGDIDSD